MSMGPTNGSPAPSPHRNSWASKELAAKTADAQLAGKPFGEYAGFVTRLVAFVIDIALIGVTVTIVGSAASLVTDFLRLSGRMLTFVQVLSLIVSASIFVGYFVLLWMLAGMTIGKRIMGLIIVREDGSKLTLSNAIRRYIGYYVSAILLLGFFWVILDARRQGWHDKLAGTLVLYDWPDSVLVQKLESGAAGEPSKTAQRRPRQALKNRSDPGDQHQLPTK
jgi:uncharacterized RDD family membrane protein YckC